MMQNGTRLLAIRIICSALICIMTIGLAAYLIAIDRAIPAPWWAISGFAVGGVVGVDIISTYLAKGGLR